MRDTLWVGHSDSLDTLRGRALQGLSGDTLGLGTSGTVLCGLLSIPGTPWDSLGLCKSGTVGILCLGVGTPGTLREYSGVGRSRGWALRKYTEVSLLGAVWVNLGWALQRALGIL